MSEEPDWEDEEFEEEEETCPYGFTIEEDCGAPWRQGIEVCEFLCPFHLLDAMLDSETCWYCNNPIKKGDILCIYCWAKGEVKK